MHIAAAFGQAGRAVLVFRARMNLCLDISLGEDSWGQLDQTYRAEGISLNEEGLRLEGEDVQFEVRYADLIVEQKKIGKGACSCVYRAQHKVTGEYYAVKMFNALDRAQAGQLRMELRSLLAFDPCDALVRIKGAWHVEGEIGIIVEFMDRGSLDFILRDSVRLDERAMAGMAYQIIWGLCYLHYENLIHRDIKPPNVLLNSLGQVKLSDFGISKNLGSVGFSHTAIGSYRYMSPERLLGHGYDSSSDIWSVGIMIIQLWTKRYPFESSASTPIDLVSELESVDVAAMLSGESFPPLMRDFILSALRFRPEDRGTAENLILAPWFEACDITDLEGAQAVVVEWLRTLDSSTGSASGLSSGIGNGLAGHKPRGGHKMQTELPLTTADSPVRAGESSRDSSQSDYSAASCSSAKSAGSRRSRDTREGAFNHREIGEERAGRDTHHAQLSLSESLEEAYGRRVEARHGGTGEIQVIKSRTTQAQVADSKSGDGPLDDVESEPKYVDDFEPEKDDVEDKYQWHGK